MTQLVRRIAPPSAAGLAVLAAALLSAQDARSGELEDALRLAGEGRCAEALALLPPDPTGASLRARGLCALRLGDYAGAVRDLESVSASDPSVAVDLAIARYHAGDRARAEQELLRAEAAGEKRAELSLYLGLIALDRAEAGDAAQRFERARQQDPLQVEPAASYYGGLARSRAGERAAARVALERVVQGWPGSEWAAEAERRLAELGDERAWFASVRLGAEHDSNAVLRGEGVVLPSEIGDEEDQRLTWRAVAGTSRSLGARTQAGGTVAFAGSLYRELTDFDVLHPSLSTWLDRRAGERTTLRAIAAYGFAWVDEQDFLSAPSVAFELHHAWRERGTTRGFLELARDDYRFPVEDDPLTPFDDGDVRDRDGLGVRFGLEHRLDLGLGRWVSAAAAYHSFDAEGREYSFGSPELEAIFETGLPAGLVLAGGARFAYRSFRNPTSYPDPDGSLPPGDRREREWLTELSLRRAFSGQLGLEARWRYQRNHSTAEVFDFTRHIFGVYATWTLSR